MNRQYAVAFDGLVSKYYVIFKDPEDQVWSTYLRDVEDKGTALEIAEALNNKYNN